MKAAPMTQKPSFPLMKQGDVQNIYHLQMPRWLFTDTKYMELALETKVAYTFLLNRFQLSRLNGWVNEDGAVFIIYTRRSLAEEMQVSYRKIIEAMKELTAAGLIWEKRCGRGDANQIYLALIVLMETARYLGRLKELIQGKRKSGYAYGRGEKYSVELGGDINRALGSEFAMLAAPETLPLFLRKLQRKGLKQYQRREPVCKGSGDIICMLDESGSAEEAAPWCKAVALALLDIAIQGKRRFAMIHFSSTGHFQTDLFLPGEFDREDVLKAAETFLGGNTDYKTPLQEALRLMDEEGFENADMVFVTDGACALPGGFLGHLKEEQARRGFSITGVLLDQDAVGFSFSLEPFCTEILRTSELTQEQIAENLLSARV